MRGSIAPVIQDPANGLRRIRCMRTSENSVKAKFAEQAFYVVG